MRTYTQDQADQAAARHAAAQAAADAARTCGCGKPAGIMLHKLTYQAGFGTVWFDTIPACGPCATALEALGWSPEKEGSDHA